MTSSILPPRRLLAPCSPMTQLRASTTLDLPDPFGPTTQVMPGSRRRVVAEANDLKPRRVRVFRCTSGDLLARTPRWYGRQRTEAPAAYRPPSRLTPAGHASRAARPRRYGRGDRLRADIREDGRDG